MVVLVDLEFGEISMSNSEKGLTINSLDAESAYKAFYQTCACNEFCKWDQLQ